MPSLQPCLAEEVTTAAALKAEDTAAEEPKANISSQLFEARDSSFSTRLKFVQ